MVTAMPKPSADDIAKFKTVWTIEDFYTNEAFLGKDGKPLYTDHDNADEPLTSLKMHSVEKNENEAMKRLLKNFQESLNDIASSSIIKPNIRYDYLEDLNNFMTSYKMPMPVPVAFSAGY